MKFKLMAVIALTAALYSCDDSTTGVGDFVSNIDKIGASSDTYKVTSRTIRLKEVYSRTNRAYLGRFTDPDFGQYSADFITQINCPEGFEFPEHLDKITGTSLELYYTGFYGDSLATMTVQVDELSKAIEEDDKDLYYTSYNPTKYCNCDDETCIAQKTYTAVDLSVSDSLRNTSGYYPGIKIDLGEKFSNKIQSLYESNPEYFKDANSFINNVLKGFYVHTIQGDGSVVYIQDIWLRINMEYTVTGSQGQDSTAIGSSVLAASKEVLMSTKMMNDDKLDELVSDNEHTYLKTPAGLCTEIELPVDEIYDKHENDTLNSITLSIKKYKDAGISGESSYKMGIPQTLLMIRKEEMNTFFEQNKTYDNETSFLGTYDSSSNSYTFSKLNRLISHIFSEKRSETGETDSDRDKVVLIPVTTETDTEGNVIGVSHDMEVNAARLFGGEQGEELKIEVIYTKP